MPGPAPTPQQQANLKKAEEDAKKKAAASLPKPPAPGTLGAQGGQSSFAQMQLYRDAGTVKKSQQQYTDEKNASKGIAPVGGYETKAEKQQGFIDQAKGLEKADAEKKAAQQNPTPPNSTTSGFTAAYEKARQEAGGTLDFETWKQSDQAKQIMQTDAYKQVTLKNQKLAETNNKKNIAAQELSKPTPPEFTGDETPEEKLTIQLSYQQELTDYANAKAEAANNELGTVSGQVSDMQQNLKDFQLKNQAAITQLNDTINGLGDRVSNVASELGVSADINNPEIQAQIKQIASDPNLSVEQQNQKIGEILKQSAATVSNPATPVGMSTPVPTAPAPASPGSPSEPELSPEQIEANAIQSDVGNFLNQPQQNLSSIVDYLKSTKNDGSDFTSADLSLMQLQTSLFTIDKSGEKLKAGYEQRKSRIMNDIEYYKGYFDEKKEAGVTRIEDAEARQQRRLELQEQQILADKADTKADLAKKTERYESFAKAQMYKMGVPVEGQAGMTMYFNAMANWNDSVKGQLGQYDEQLRVVHDKQIEIGEAYLDKIFEFTNSIDDKEMAQMDKLSDKWDQIDADELLDEKQSDLLRMQAIGGFFEDKKGAAVAKEAAIAQDQKDEKQAMLKMYADQEQRMWDVQLEGIKASGGVPSIGADGKPTFMLDENGNMVKNSTQTMNEFEMQKYFATMNDMELHQDSETGEWLGYNKHTGQMVNYGMNDPMSGSRMGGFDMASYMEGETVDLGGGKSVTIGGVYGPGQGNNAECVGGARYLNPKLPNGLYTIQDKIAISNDPVNSSINGQAPIPPQVGSTVFLGYKGVGHAATVTALYQENGVKYMDYIDVNGDGKSNKWGQKTRVPISSAKGFWTDPSGGQVIQPQQTGPINLTKKQKADAEGLRKEFNGLQSVQDFKATQTNASQFKNIINTGIKGPADVALIFQFMKTLDPTSVVKEGEFNLAAGSGGLFAGKLEKLQGYVDSGQLLTDNVKKDFLTIVDQALKAKTSTFNADLDRYTKLSKDYGVPPESVVQDYAKEANAQFGEQPQMGPEQQQVGFDTNRKGIIEELRTSPDTYLQALVGEIAHTPAEIKSVQEQFEKYFGPQWKKYTVGKVNEVNIADIILSLN